MANFKRDNRGGGGKFGKKNFGARDAKTQMHDAVCNKCGKRCQVPFRPTGQRPIFCSDCFEKSGPMPERDRSRAFGRDDRGSSRFEKKRLYSAVCSNCNKKCEVPFLPTGGRATYCKECFDKGVTTDDRASNDRKHAESRPFSHSHSAPIVNSKPQESYKGQFEALNAKLDKILHILSSTSVSQPVKKEIVSVITETPKAKETTKKSKKKATEQKKSKKAKKK